MEVLPVKVTAVTPEAGTAAAAATKAAASDAGVNPTQPAVDGTSPIPPPVPEEKLEGKDLLEALKKQVRVLILYDEKSV